jgi:hypothetical protein
VPHAKVRSHTPPHAREARHQNAVVVVEAASAEEAGEKTDTMAGQEEKDQDERVAALKTLDHVIGRRSGREDEERLAQ